MSYSYLASPYSHPDPAVRDRRYDQAELAVGWLLQHKIWVYSPIVHCHALVKRFEWRFDAEFWREYNEAMLIKANSLIILGIDGWQESEGVQHETDFVWQRNVPIQFIVPEHIGRFRFDNLVRTK